MCGRWNVGVVVLHGVCRSKSSRFSQELLPRVHCAYVPFEVVTAGPGEGGWAVIGETIQIPGSIAVVYGFFVTVEALLVPEAFLVVLAVVEAALEWLGVSLGMGAALHISCACKQTLMIEGTNLSSLVELKLLLHSAQMWPGRVGGGCDVLLWGMGGGRRVW